MPLSGARCKAAIHPSPELRSHSLATVPRNCRRVLLPSLNLPILSSPTPVLRSPPTVRLCCIWMLAALCVDEEARQVDREHATTQPHVIIARKHSAV